MYNMKCKRKLEGSSLQEECKKSKLECSTRTSDNLVNSSNEEDAAEIANQFASKCREAVQPKYLKGDLDSKVTLQYFDLTFTVIDEISLEGLDGITLEGLWKRIKKPTFILNSKAKEFIWAIICAVNDIECYILNEPRSELIISDEPNTLDIIRGTVDKDLKSDIYEFCVVSDTATETVGSCAAYSRRENLTKHIKTLPLSTALTYGNKLVLVASQRLRNHALFSSFIDPNIDLTPLHYCILERIGRSREQGEKNLQLLCKDAQQMFYIKRTLVKNGLVRRQPTNSNKNIGGAFTISRFNNESKMRSLLITEHIVNVLKQMPDYRIDYLELSNIFDFNVSLKSLHRISEFKKFVTTIQYSYKEFYPDSDKSEWKVNGASKERKVKALVLKDPNVNIQAGWMDDSSESESEEDENGCGIAINRTLLNQGFELILLHKQEGVSVLELKKLMNIDFYMARMILRILEKRNFIDYRKVDDFRQHKMRYFAKCSNLPEFNISHELITNKLNSNTARLKRGLSQMSKLLVNDLSEPAEKYKKTLFEKRTAENDLKLLSFPKDLSKKLRCNGFTLRTVEEQVANEQIAISPSRFALIEQITFKSKLVERRHNESSIAKHKETSDCTSVKSILIEALLLKLENISQLVQNVDSIASQDEMDHVCRPPQSNKPELKQAERKNVLPQRTMSIMGSSPFLDATFVDDDGVTVEIISSTRPNTMKKDNSAYRPLTKDKSLRFAKRANLIINSVRQEKILTLFRLKQIVLNAEAEEGCEFQIDKKSLLNVIKVLIQEGFLKAYKVIISRKPLLQEQCLICSLDVEADDEQLKRSIDCIKTKLLLPTTKEVKPVKSKHPLETDDVNGSLHELKDLNKSIPHAYKPSKSIGWEYGFTPKFARMQVLHKLLFYLLYDFSEDCTLGADEWLRNYMPEEDLKELPPVYHLDTSWKMFIPPLPQYKHCSKGWILLSDVLLRLPLSLFVKIYRIKFIIPELMNYLNHPIKKHFLIKHLPQEIRSALLYKRMYISTCYETLCRLCWCGLVQFNRMKYTDKDQVFIYVNRNAILYDTTSSPTGYHQVAKKDYKKISYNFGTLNDVQQYWCQLFTISMKTPLGYRSSLCGSIANIENISTKPGMIEALSSRNDRTAFLNDTGYIPGDHLGAAGLDSALWPHLKYNWMRSKCYYTKEKQTKKVSRKRKLNIQPIRFEELEELRKNSYNSVYGVTSRIKVVRKQQHKKQIIKGAARKTTKRRKVLYYDKIDKAILKKMTNVRSRWTAQEDHFLGLCRIAICFLCPNWNKNFIPYTTIRDIIHRLIPQSHNKTSRACQRRSLFLFKKKNRPEMNPLVEAENLLVIPFIKKYFKKFRDRAKDDNVEKRELITAFIYLVYYLYKNSNAASGHCQHEGRNLLTLGNINKIMPLPDQGSGRCCYYKNPNGLYDIKTNLIKSIIHSSLGCNENTVTLAYRLYCVYRTFPDQLLKLALQELNHMHLLSAKKAHIRRKLPRNNLVLPMPYQFSATYIFTQMPDYPINVYQEAREFLNNICQFAKTNSYYILEKFEQGHNAGFGEAVPHFNVKLLFEIPEEALHLNPQIDDHSELVQELAQRYLYLLKKKSVESEYETSTEQSENLNKVEAQRVVSSFPQITIEEVIEKVIKAHDCSDANQRQALQKSIETDLQHLDTNPDDEEEEDEVTLLKQEHVLLNSSEKKEQEAVSACDSSKSVLFPTNEDQSLPTLEDIITGMMQDTVVGEKRKIPHITELSVLLSKGMFPEGVFDDDDEKLDRLSKHFVVTFPTAKMQVLENVEENQCYQYFKNFTESCKTYVDFIRNDHNIDDSAEFIQKLDVQVDSELYVFTREIINFVSCKQNLGATAAEIKNKFGYTDTLKETLQLLLDKRIIFKVGISSILFVHFEYRYNWFLKHIILTEEDKLKLKYMQGTNIDDELLTSTGNASNGKLIKISPWIMINGKINENVLKKWAGTILSYCLKNPKVLFNTIKEKFCYLKPVDIYTLLEYLQKLECVKMRAFRCETNLVSIDIITNKDEVCFLDEWDNIYVDVFPASILRMGHFLLTLESEFHSAESEAL